MSLIHSIIFLVACASVQPFLFPGTFPWISLPGIQLPGSGSSGSGGSGSGCITQMGCIEGGNIVCKPDIGCPNDDNAGGNGALCYWPNTQTGCGSTPACLCANETTTRFG